MTPTATAEQHSYVPTLGSSERSAWDALTSEERTLCDRRIADTTGSVADHLYSESVPAPRRYLVLRALGH